MGKAEMTACTQLHYLSPGLVAQRKSHALAKRRRGFDSRRVHKPLTTNRRRNHNRPRGVLAGTAERRNNSVGSRADGMQGKVQILRRKVCGLWARGAARERVSMASKMSRVQISPSPQVCHMRVTGYYQGVVPASPAPSINRVCLALHGGGRPLITRHRDLVA